MTNTTATVAKVGLSVTSGGAVTAGLFHWETPYVILMLIGFIVSIIAFLYNEAHVSKSDTKFKLATKGTKYSLLGVFMFPTAYVYSGLEVWLFAPFQAFIGIALTLAIVSLYDAFVDGKIKKFREG